MTMCLNEMHFPDFSSLSSSKFIKTEEGKGQIVAVESLGSTVLYC